MSTSHPQFEGFQNRLNSQKENLESIVIRGFRAIDDLSSCQRFLQGHIDVIAAFGFKLSSATEAWMYDPNTYVVIVESHDRKRTFGGARLQMRSPSNPLPVEGAIGIEAPEIFSFLEEKRDRRLAEICGLWNSVNVAGMGVGSVYSIRSAIALGELVGIEEMIALCSVHTYRMAHKYGFQLIQEIGNQGAIPYAGANQTAHITYQPNISHLPNSNEEERNLIMDLRKKPVQVKKDNGNPSELEIFYQLQI
jgi:hypothetical protein